MECKICKSEYKNHGAFGYHLKINHQLEYLEYCHKYDNELLLTSKKYKRYLSKNFPQPRIYTKETREKQRNARVKFLSDKNNRTKTAWYNKSQGVLSYLENKFVEDIIKTFNLMEKYDIINEYCEYPYFIDFAFLNIKVAVELDGKCHFINQKRIDHDIKRDIILNEKGWKIYRISYLDIKDDTYIQEFLNFLHNINDYDTKVYGNNLYTYTEINTNTKEKYLKNIKLEVDKLSSIINFNNKENITSKRILNKELYIHEQTQYITLIENSQIDFSKIGWVKQVSKILNKKEQKVNNWMKTFMPEFYETKCFKRKLPHYESDVESSVPKTDVLPFHHRAIKEL